MVSLPSPCENREFVTRGQAAQNSRFSEVAFWSILDASGFSFLSSRESGIYGGEGGQFRILDSQGLCLREHFGRFFILPARIGDPWIGDLEVRN